MPKQSVLISSLAAVAVVGGFAYWMLSVDGTLGSNFMGPKSTVPIPAPNNQNENDNAIANQWQWDKFTASKPAQKPSVDDENAEEDEPGSSGEVPYDVVLIYNMLQDMQIDDYGQVVPDQAAKYALEKAFDDLGSDLSPEAMAELQELIRIGLPGAAGEEAARVLEDYFQFRLAEEEFNREAEEQLAADSNTQLEQQAPSVDRYEELVQLRRRFLGAEIADELFAVQDAQARHMFATVAIHQNDGLTDEEKQAELDALQEQLNDRLLGLGELTPEQAATEEVKRMRENGVSDAEIYAAREDILGPEKAQELAAADREEEQWQSRFDGYWQARQRVMEAGLEEAERERQIEQLLGQYFSSEELERARFTSLQWQSGDRE